MSKRNVTPETLAESARLKQIWDAKKAEIGLTQDAFGEKYQIGGQSAVGQFLRGTVPLSMKAAKGFARGLRCEISDFSPRLAKEARDIANVVESGGDYPDAEVLKADSAAPAPGYIRLEHLSPRPSMGAGCELEEPVYIVQYLDVLEDWVRRKIGAADPKRIKVLTGIGRSMSPTIEHEDLVFVDTGCNTIDHPDIYVLSVGPRLLLKRALILVGEKVLVLKSDNETEFPDAERIPLAQADSVAVAGRVKAWWTLRR